jgi:predicted transcriptional regulator
MFHWLRRRSAREDPDPLDAIFGHLETRVLEALWRRSGSASVRDLQADFPAIAYTTLMTTLDRLHRKGVLDRVKVGRAFAYRPRHSRDELRGAIARDALGAILGPDAATLQPVISFFVDAVSRRDRDALDELAELVRQRAARAREDGR